MINFKSILKQLRATVFSSLLVITSLFGFISPAQANSIHFAAMTGNRAVPTIENNKRIQAVASCLPEQLTIQNQDPGNRISRAFSEMKNDQLERILDITDNPKLSDAEIEFKNCLQQKGFTPQAVLQNR